MSNTRDLQISEDEIEQFETLWPLLLAMKNEYSELSKKKQDGTLNKLKVHGVNRLLADLKALLKDEPSVRYLDVLSDDDLPQYSDVIIILSQFVAAMNAFKEARQHQDDSYQIVWTVGDD
jgi:hypothetical protein